MRLWSFVACLLVPMSSLLGCAPAPLEPVHDAARSDFSRDHYCPIERIATSERVGVTPIPAPIAKDPERLALWNARHKLSAPRSVVGQDGAKASLIVAAGCGEVSAYACTIEGGWVPARRRMEYVDTVAVCSER